MAKIEGSGGIAAASASISGHLSVANRKAGYVALLDVLGFRNLVRTDSEGSQIVRYVGTIEGALLDQRVESVVFSDTIVVTKESTEPESLQVLCEVCSRLMLSLLRVDIPVRGAIARGTYLRSTVANSVFLAGDPIIEAYEWEQKQDWIGIMLAPSAVRGCRDIQLETICNTTLDRNEVFPNVPEHMQWKAYLQRCETIPVRSNRSSVSEPYVGYAVLPGGQHSFEETAQSLKLAVECLDRQKLWAPSPSEQRKYVATIEWLRPFCRKWRNWADEYRAWKQDHDR